MVDVRVIAKFSHEGRALRPGDRITVTPVEAASLRRRGLVSLTREYQTRVTPVVPEPEPEPTPRRRRYRRRDLTAEPS